MNYAPGITIGIKGEKREVAVAKRPAVHATRISDRAFYLGVASLTSTALLAGAVVVGYAAYRLIIS